MFLGSYHYFYWGSKLCPAACFDHRAILSRLARLANERMIFAGRLEIDRLPRYLRDRARRHPAGVSYTTRSFLAAAREFFQVTPCGHLGRDELYLMMKKTSRGD